MIISIDTSLFFDALKDSQIRRTLHHLKNNGHKIVVPLTVAGELVMQGIQEGKLDEFYKIFEILKEIDVDFLIPTPLLRDCCHCIDEHIETTGTYGSSTMDRTHLAYSIAHNCDFYITKRSEIRTLKIPDDCLTELKIISPDEIKKAI